jgi:hypothetical protein
MKFKEKIDAVLQSIYEKKNDKYKGKLRHNHAAFSCTTLSKID